jgi:hypothetical protein
MTISALKSEVLTTLRENRKKHSAIVKEAREGYMAKAQAALSAKLDQLRSGKLTSLSFSLHVPLDYTKVYDTAIRMLELHTEEKIKLDAAQVRNLMQDEWDWSDQFYGTNMVYSKMATDFRNAGEEG